VRVCYRNSDKKKFAVKIIGYFDEEKTLMKKKSFLIWKSLRHKNIIAARKLFINYKSDMIHLVLDYCSYPSLLKLMEKKIRFSESET